jgi:nucleoid-associated protein YgaU
MRGFEHGFAATRGLEGKLAEHLQTRTQARRDSVSWWRRKRIFHPSTQKRNAMGLISFMKDAGQRLFGAKDAEAAAKAAETAPHDAAAKAKAEELNAAAAEAIVNYIRAQGLDARQLDVLFDGATATVNVYGVAADQATREKILLCCGNVAGVAAVNDRMQVDDPQPEAQWHEVVSGDNLSKIAKKFYGDANKYPVVFEANRPMLAHPDKIYPGQKLRIPPL